MWNNHNFGIFHFRLPDDCLTTKTISPQLDIVTRMNPDFKFYLKNPGSAAQMEMVAITQTDIFMSHMKIWMSALTQYDIII